MPSYYFRVRAANQAPHLIDQCEVSGLSEALAVANGTARELLRNRVHRAPGEIRGCLDIDDETHQTVARVMLADVARRFADRF